MQSCYSAAPPLYRLHDELDDVNDEIGDLEDRLKALDDKADTLGKKYIQAKEASEKADREVQVCFIDCSTLLSGIPAGSTLLH